MPTIKPMRDDILLSFVSTKEDVKDTGIWIPDSSKSNFEYYKVEAVGSNVDGVKPGDVVIAKWANMTEPFTYENKRYAVTDIKQIMAVVEEED